MADHLTPVYKAAAETFSTSIIEVQKHFAHIDKNDVANLFKDYRQLSLFKTLVDALAKQLFHLEDELSHTILPETLKNLQLDSIKSGGYTYSLGIRTFASIPIPMQEKGFKWLRENGFSALIKDNVNAKTLSSAINSYMEEHGKKPPEDAIVIYQKEYISVRKS